MFVVSGEALMDVFAVGDTLTGTSLDARVGGSPFNVAVGLARLGQRVAFFGGLSSGFLGDRLLRALRDEGVDIGSVERIDAPTTLGLIGLDAHGVPSYGFYGEGAADRLLTPASLDRVPTSARVMCFGSYAMVVEPVAGTLRTLVERRHAGSLIAYDPNVRLNVVPDVARWRDVLHWMLPRAHLLKLSDEDLGLLFPGHSEHELAAAWCAQGPAAVVVTRGGEGAHAYLAGGRIEIPPVPVTVVDTVGAGDTFQAAMLAALAERDALSAAALAALPRAQWAEVLEFAGRAAAITCSRRGADMPCRSELHPLA